MAFPTPINGQITDLVTSVDSDKHEVLQELVGRVSSSLAVAAQKGLDEDEQGKGLAVAAMLCGVKVASGD